MNGISRRSMQVTLAALDEREAATSIPEGAGQGVGHTVMKNSAAVQYPACEQTHSFCRLMLHSLESLFNPLTHPLTPPFPLTPHPPIDSTPPLTPHPLNDSTPPSPNPPIKPVPTRTTRLPSAAALMVLAWAGSRRRNTFSRVIPGTGMLRGAEPVARNNVS